MGKLRDIESIVENLRREMNESKIEVDRLKSDKEQMEHDLRRGAREVKDLLEYEAEKVHDEVKQSFTNQKAKNNKFTQNLNDLKKQKTDLQKQILELQRRMKDLEFHVGIEELEIQQPSNFNNFN